MAAQLQHEKRTLSIKLENGENNEGEMTYTTKSFGNLRAGASADSIYAVAEGIRALLAKTATAYYVNKTEKLYNE